MSADGVEAVAGTIDQFCVLEGGSVTLIAFTNITGNPVPQSSWELIGGTLGGDTTSRELTITNAASSGNYTVTLQLTLLVDYQPNPYSRTTGGSVDQQPL